MARINEIQGLTEQQLRLDEMCEFEEQKIESEAMDEYKREHYSSSGGKHSEISLSPRVIEETKEE